MSVSPVVLRDSTHNYSLPTTNTSTNDEITTNSSTQTLVNKTLIDPTITINDTDLKTEIFKMIYPIGSIYASKNDIQGEKYVLNNHPVVNWLGCIWQAMDENVFMRSCKFAISGNSWSWVDDGESGGNATHTHQYGVQYAAYYGHVCGTSDDKIQLYDNGSWVDAETQHSSSGSFRSISSGSTIDGTLYNNIVQTTSASSLPPYQNVFIYFRIE